MCNNSMAGLVRLRFFACLIAGPAQVVVGAVVALDTYALDGRLAARLATHTIVLCQSAQKAQRIWAQLEYSHNVLRSTHQVKS